ncbi:MAG: thioredoxin domain-containing protein [Verrucomicrobiales bacterium]|nr:thioredoxin domain-containing protein [Verrucomicrobiales bacterium]
MPRLLPRFFVVFSLLCVHGGWMMNAEEGHVRKPLPSQEELAKLPEDGGKEFNRLVFEQSPYLLQHARNPVDWRPWGEVAFAEAKKQDKPVFLSIGYTTCHWCHVMEHESFEDEEVAALINESFIAVKVDREERPDIDDVYMQITQGITGGGGWPMTVVLTPDKHAFFAGTYFPKESVAGRPGIKRVVSELRKAWVERREEVEETALNISAQVGKMMGASPGGDLDVEVLDTAFEQFVSRYDSKKGGFAVRPKFPVPPNLLFLLRYHHRTGNPQALEMVEKTLTEMRRGGVYDQIGYGIHRYATDPDWLVPHFEKMLYDQALVTIANLEAYQVTGKQKYARTAREILSYVQREMTSPEGGFYSAEDADSEGEEGKFYVWTSEEISEVLGGEDAAFFLETFHFEDEGNFLEESTREKTGANIPHLKEDPLDEALARIEPLRKKLFEVREKRTHPQKDDKILTDWNGLMIAAFARAAQVLGDEEYKSVAAKASDFVLDKLTTGDGRLLKRYRQGEAGLTAHLEDYTFMIWGLLDTYEATFEVRYLEKAIELQAMMDEFFWDEQEGGYFTIADDAEQLIVRAKKLYGGAIPSGNAAAIGNLLRLHRMTGQPHFATRGDELVRAFSAELGQNSMVYPLALVWLDFQFGPSREIVISGEEADHMVKALQKPYLPNKVILYRTGDNAEALAKLAPFTETQVSEDGKATAYVCESFACKMPTTGISEMLENLGLKDQ